MLLSELVVEHSAEKNRMERGVVYLGRVLRYVKFEIMGEGTGGTIALPYYLSPAIL